MADRVPVGFLPGVVSARAGEDFPVGNFGSGGTISRVFLRVSDAPTTADLVLSLRNASGGGGQGIDVTIAIGAKSATATGTLSFSAGQDVFLRVVSGDASALNLDGWYEVA